MGSWKTPRKLKNNKYLFRFYFKQDKKPFFNLLSKTGGVEGFDVSLTTVRLMKNLIIYSFGLLQAFIPIKNGIFEGDIT